MRIAKVFLFVSFLAAALVGCQQERPSLMKPDQTPGRATTLVDASDVPVQQFLGDRVWHDVNQDGIQANATLEPGIPGVFVDVYTCAGVFVARDTTDAEGYYGFINLPPADYKIQFIVPAGWTVSPRDQGANDQVDSDANPADGWTICTSLAANELDFSWDMGLYAAPVVGSIGDFVWVDTNRNGIQENSEQGRAGVTVELMDCADTVLNTMVTDANGLYLFTGLAAGDYKVHFVLPADFVFSPADQGANDALDSDALAGGKTVCFTLAPGQNDLTRDAGIYLPTGSIGDYVWVDTDRDGVQESGEPGRAGVTVELMDCSDAVLDTRVTDSNGLYLFTGLAAGNYKVHFVLPTDFVFSPADQGGNDNLDSDALAGGKTVCFSLATGQNDLTRDAGIYLPTGSIGDYVWVDTNRDGIQNGGEAGHGGVTVELMDCSDNVLGTRVTDANGLYLFTGLAAGNYKVHFVLPAGFVFSPADQGSDDALDSDALVDGKTTCFTLGVGQTDLTRDAGIYAPCVSAIGDFVWVDSDHDGIQDATELGLSGVVVKLRDCNGNILRTTTTDASGHYLFSDVAAGYYKVQVVLPDGYLFSPRDSGSDNQRDSDVGSDGKTCCFCHSDCETDLSWDVGVYPCIGSIGDRVWLDGDHDGIQDASEQGLPGVQVRLLDCYNHILANTTTDASGNYLFTNLDAGSYRVQFVLLDGYNFSPANRGNDYSRDSDAEDHGKSDCFCLTDCQSITTIDAGMYQCVSSIGDRVWNDTDHDGLQDSGEPGLAGAEVKLLDCYSHVLRTTTTDANGNYIFTNVAAGSYKVQFTLLDGYIYSPANRGSDIERDSDADCGDGKTSCFCLTDCQVINCIDGGMYQCVTSIGDRVWNDTDQDGIQDSGETGLPGVEVKLRDCNGHVLRTTTTDASGNYLFTNVAPGNYKIGFTLLDGYRFSPSDRGNDESRDSDADCNDGKTCCFCLTTCQSITSIDAGMYLCVSSVGDRVWNDCDRDGIQDNGESGLSGVEVKLRDCDGHVLRTTTTDASGNYVFSNVTPGNYKVQFVLPDGYRFSPQDRGSDESRDSDADCNDGKTCCFCVTACQAISSADAGMYRR